MYYVRNTLLRNHWQWRVNRRVRSSCQEIKLLLKFIAGALVVLVSTRTIRALLIVLSGVHVVTASRLSGYYLVRPE